MSTAELEVELARHRGDDVDASTARPLTIEEALAYRNRGNLPDPEGRTLRLVLHIGDRAELTQLSAKRLLYEPDYHERPTWRRHGSAPVNIVPLRTKELEPTPEIPWWKDPDLASLEDEWKRTGRVAGLTVPAVYRGFVYKTVLALRANNHPVTPTSVADSMARWLPRDEADRIRSALVELNES